MARMVAELVEGEALRADEALAHGEERTGEAAEEGAERERRELGVAVLMPSERQAISSSRSASQARPIGSRRSRIVTKLVRSASARIR